MISVRWTLCSSENAIGLDILTVTSKKVVELFECPAVIRYPGPASDICATKPGTNDRNVEQGAHGEQPCRVVVRGSTAKGANNLLKARTVSSRYRVKISSDKELIVRGDVSDSILQEIVEAIFVCIGGIFGGGVRYQDSEMTVAMRQSGH